MNQCGKTRFRRAAQYSYSANTTEVGKTLIELLVTVAIIGIVSSIAIPGYHGYVQHSELVTLTQTLRETIQYSRQLSRHERTTYTLCPMQHDKCISDWHAGTLTVFVDSNKDLKRQTNEEIARQIKLNSHQHTIRLNRRHNKHIRTKANGYFNYFGSYFFCPTDGSTIGGRLIMNTAGRLRYERTNRC